MRTYDFGPLFRSVIGFDEFARVLDDASRADAVPTYPPYNVELVEENQYRITMALAGFDRSDLDIETERNTLKISGRRRADSTQRTFLHRGIAERDFEHRFRLADHVKVTAASLDNGLLRVDLVREIPEALKPRRIDIGQGGGVAANANKSRLIDAADADTNGAAASTRATAVAPAASAAAVTL